MAGGQERILRRRIRSVQATKKITRAMELIAASRIAKAQQRVGQAVPYADKITEVVRNLAAAGGGAVSSPLLEKRPEIRRVQYVVLTADRGLCGGYNTTVLRAAEGEVKQQVLAGREYSLVLVGRKAETYFRFRGYTIDRAFGGFSDNPTYDDAKAIGEYVVPKFIAGDVDLIQLIYTRFVSPGFQEVVIRPLAPLERELLGDPTSEAAREAVASYEFEPSPTTILDSLLPRYTEGRVWAALLNAAASEHAARQRAMKAATDNAEELIRTLTRVMNRARQDAITTEIMEIVGGAEALRAEGGPSEELLTFAGHDVQGVPVP